MGSRNLVADSDVHRRVAAREILSATLPKTANSAGISGKARRNDSGAGLALSGRTVTAKGHVIVPPTKAKIIAFEYERAPSESIRDMKPGEHDATPIGQPRRTISLVPTTLHSDNRFHRDDGMNSEYSRGSIASKASRMSVTHYEFGSLGRGERNSTNTSVGDGLRRVNNANKTVSAAADRSAASRESRIDRNHRSVSATSALGTVTATKSEVAPHIAALRQEYSVKKQSRVSIDASSSQSSSTQRDLIRAADTNQGRTARRRRGRVGAPPNEQLESPKQSNSNRTTATGINALGNSANARPKYSPYLPMYIQPVEEESSYRSQSNHMLYHNQGSLYAAQRNRKISTEMNRYQSSSSSSSSSESDQDLLSQTVADPVIKDAPKPLNAVLETPDTSDTESRCLGSRRRRRRPRVAVVGTRQEGSQSRLDNQVTRGEVSSRGRLRRRNRHNDIPQLDDKYITLPDNYKQSVVHTGSILASGGDVAHLSETPNSQDDTGEEHSSPRSESGALRGSSRCTAKLPATAESSISTGTSDSISSRTNSNQLIIGRNSRLCYGKTLLVSPHDISLSEEHLVPESSNSDCIDFSVSSPDLDKSHRSTRSSQTGDSPLESVARGRIERRNSIGESKVLGNKQSIFDDNNVPIGDIGAASQISSNFGQGNTQSKPSTGKGSLHSVHEDAVIPSQPRIQARKVSEDFWPRDEATEKLLRHSRTVLAPSSTLTSKNDYSKASRTMQETIDGLHEFANESTPLKSRSNSIPALSDNSKNCDTERSSSAELGTQSGSHRVGRKGSRSRGAINPSRMQARKFPLVDASSPCMSSTETLKEHSSSGECQEKNSRSPSIDSTASNPEAITGNVKDRSISGNVVYGRSLPVQNNVRLFISEGPNEDNSPTQAQNVGSETNAGTFNSNNSLLEVMNNLNKVLKRIVKPQPLPNTPLVKANVCVDTLMNVSPKGNVTCHPPRLETLSEDPEPTSPAMKRKQEGTSTTSAKISPKDGTEDSLEIDEGIVTEVEEEVNKDPQSYLKLDEYLKQSDRRTKRQTQPKDGGDSGSNGNESVRSLSDPSADRKRPQQGTCSVDSNFLGALQNGKKVDIGPLDHASLSSSSQISEHPSSYSDTLNIDELISEPSSAGVGDAAKAQAKSVKKKSKSDPNPEGYAAAVEVINDGHSGLQLAFSEPNVTEQGDQLGELAEYQVYRNAKQIAMHERSPGKLQLVQEPVFHAHVSPRIPRPKSKKFKIRENNSFIGQLLADNSALDYNNEIPINDRSIHTSSPTPFPVMPQESSPVQKDDHEALFQESEEFNRVFHSMTSEGGSPSPKEPDPSAHSRSSSEPAHVGQIPRLGHDSPTRQYQASYGNWRSGGGMTPSLGSAGNTAETGSLHGGLNEPSNYGQDDAVFPPANQSRGRHDMRLHAFRNLRDTERSYLNSLRILFNDYMKPLKLPEHQLTCEPRLVDEMFYKIPQLVQHHEKFFKDVQRCYEEWNRDIRLGDLFLNSFNKDALLDTYTAYITNYLNAREAVRTAEAKEAFRRFTEQCRSENKDRQGLADLMIMPVQRIPRYELLIKDMLKHTPEGHPDRDGLEIAQKEIHKLAVQMNRSEKEAEAEEKQDRLLTEIEQLIENLSDLFVPKRRFLRQDIVTEIQQGATKKDRSIWLFSDLIVCTSRKKGGAGFRRGSVLNLNVGQEKYSSVDPAYKYKFMWKFPLEDVENLKGNTQVPGRHTVDRHVQTLENDLNVLTSMQRQATQIESNHMQLDDALRELMASIGKQIAEKRQQSLPSTYPPGRVELGILTRDGMDTFLFEFLNDENKVQFEKQFANAKRRLTTRWEPTFMKAIPISRTRAGMQFSCAACNVDSSQEAKEVWVCNTDGYVGQVCFLTLEPEPNQTQCITVCHAKICCIAQVPTWERRLVSAQKFIGEVEKGAIASPTVDPVRNIMSWDDDEDSDEGNTESPHSTNSSISSQYSRSPYSTVNGGENMTSPDLVSLPGYGRPKDQNRAVDGAAWRKDNDGTTLHGSLDDLLQGESEPVVGDAQSRLLAGKDSMWLGTEDGKIHIYPSSQSTRGNKHCVRLAHSAAVHCILYHEGQVFVALSNGDLVVYTRNLTTGEWDFENQKTKTKISSPYAMTKMVVVGGKELWCGCQNLIKIINMKNVSETDQFAVTNDNKRQIYCMVCCEYGVWVALDKRPIIKLYHTVTHVLLADIDVSNPVSKMLASADAIIRQHKAACLRITSLLVCNDLLWVGTSAGVVLTLTLPKVTPSTSALAMPVIPQGLSYGHTGHVRFLACAEIPDKEQNSLSRGGSRRASTSSGRRRPSSNTSAPSQPRAVSVIISGGDGYEDFRMNSTSESAGRDDSTNHLLVWRT